MNNPLVVLLTDYGLQDGYAGVVKGVLNRYAPKITILDLTHGIEPQHIHQAAYVIMTSYSYFQAPAVFLCVVDPGVGSKRKILAFQTASGYFLAPDNGLLTGVLEKERGVVRYVSWDRIPGIKTPSSTFHGRDIFAPLAAFLAAAPNPKHFFSRLGPVARNPVKLDDWKPCLKAGFLEGKIIYFDHFGNAITNISRTDLPAKGKCEVEAVLSGRLYQKLPFAENYSVGNSLAALWNSADFLELAAPSGSARDKFKLREGSPVRAKLL